ncbi:hypothetical protein ACIQPP_13930 [Streptomyces violaceusniger]|uniref:hypothetical protein n=1 Tax=Streptomyces violaceusniger TaxID=68280 RepID=UPI00099880C0|nr:hypothetical protein [Streptomyces hygroscopicus]AQW51782.1 hypothetical protein SHXM_05245 [Streptomyces hygroscopicus]
MTTQTQQTTSPAAQQQGSHHFVLTLQVPHHSGQGFITATFSNTLTPLPSNTRADIYALLREQVGQAHPELAKANVLFFSLEPNGL